MRLIDADKLKFKHKCRYGEHTTKPYTLSCISFDEIQKAPTIKAIPIEVLEEIKAEIEALEIPYEDYEDEAYVGYDVAKGDVVELIDRKISEVTE